MPLNKGTSKEAFSKNVSQLRKEKYPMKQALAIAYSVKRKGRAQGGPVAGTLAAGVAPTPIVGPAGLPAGGLPAVQGVAPDQGAGVPGAPSTGSLGPPGAGIMGGGPQGSIAPPLPPMGAPQMKRGGSTPERYKGGHVTQSMTRGPILSSIPGRTDAHFTHVPSGSYVIPADIVSGRGEGNTIAGAESLQKLFRMAPYGGTTAKFGRRKGGFPKPSKKLKSGGAAEQAHVGKPVRVNLAGGEIVVPPEHLSDVVHPDLKTAHDIMDKWVLNERKKLRSTLAKLPGPVKS